MMLKRINSLRLTCLLGALFLVLAYDLVTTAQSVSQFDRGTPPQHAAGLSVGTYISTDLGAINLGNGALNISLHIGDVGGRGFSFPINLNYSSKVWSALGNNDIGPDCATLKSVVSAVYGQNTYDADLYNRVAGNPAGWTYGGVPALKAQGVLISPVMGQSCAWRFALVKLTVLMPDGGSIELRDDVFDGEPQPAQTDGGCLARDANRGTSWHATDGSGIVFVSDGGTQGASYGDLSGTVITADGLRYHFTNVTYSGGIQSANQIHNLARCDKVTDRNGNFIQIAYPGPGPFKETDFTDQLGRLITVRKNAVDPDNPGGPNVPLLISVPGYSG